MSKKLDKVLDLFIGDSYRKFSVREVARLVNISPSSASKYLNQFLEGDTASGLVKDLGMFVDKVVHCK